MKNKVIIDTNCLLHLYDPNTYGDTWTNEKYQIFDDILNSNSILLIYPIVVSEYVHVIKAKYLTTNNISFSKFKKIPKFESVINKPLSYLKLLPKKFKFVKTKEYKNYDDFWVYNGEDVVDSWIIKQNMKVASLDKPLTNKLKKQNRPEIWTKS